MPYGVLVDQSDDLRLFAKLGNPCTLSHTAARTRSAIQLLFGVSLLAASVAGAVVGGQVASVDDLIRRSVVEISGPACSGVVISDRHVLTAAHCTAELSPLVILKSSLYQDCSHALVDDVLYPPTKNRFRSMARIGRLPIWR